MYILTLDVGTTHTAYCIGNLYYDIIEFNKVDNEYILGLINSSTLDTLAYEEFASYGMPIGKSTMESIKWNGRYIQKAIDNNLKVVPIFRKDVKINLCGTMKAKDTNIRQALINRFAQHDFKNGKGTKNNKDVFYGVSADMWSAIALYVTYLDKLKEDKGY
jgi:hypothetical protein